jgi:hypothetical protein
MVLNMQKHLLDTVAHLPELNSLHISTYDDLAAKCTELANFKPTEGLRYVDEVVIGGRLYAFEKDGLWSARYREI